MNSPTISVVMPVYNGGMYLNEAINSILNQTYKDFEFIIINDGSTDKTEEIILSYDDPRIVYVKNVKNLQIVKTLNKGVGLAKGEYIARMDSDDISLPERFEEQVKLLATHQEIGICGSWVELIGEKKGVWEYPIKHEEIVAKNLFNSTLVHPSVMGRKSIFKENLYLEEFIGAEDYALWITVSLKYNLANIPKTLLLYRVHKLSKTNKNDQLYKANQLRKKQLKAVGVNFTSSNLELFFKICNFIPVPIFSINSLFLEIEEKNKTTLLFKPAALHKILSEYYYFQITHQIIFDITLFLSYYKSPYRQHGRLSATLTFFIKYLLNWNKND